VVETGSKEPISGTYWVGPSYRGAFSQKVSYCLIADDFQHERAWDLFDTEAMRRSYKGVQLLLDNKVVAEAFRNPNPKDDYDIYRIRIFGCAPAILREFVLEKIRNGERIISTY
jgi:hypothetical protein